MIPSTQYIKKWIKEHVEKGSSLNEIEIDYYSNFFDYKNTDILETILLNVIHNDYPYLLPIKKEKA